MVMNIELLRFITRPNYYRNHHAKFEIDRTILSSLNKRKKLSVTDGRADGPTLIIEKLRF